MSVFPEWHREPNEPVPEVPVVVHNDEWDEDVEDGEFGGDPVKLNLPHATDDGYIVHAKNPQGSVAQLHLLRSHFNNKTGSFVNDKSNERYWYQKIVALGLNVEEEADTED